MKIIVTGAKGQLGTDVVSELIARGEDVVPVDIDELDITDKQKTEVFFLAENSDGVIHCAAFTNVDLAETEREKCRAVNVNGTENVASACKKCGAKMIYISTDYVFGGEGEEPFETDAPAAPCNYYGETKYEGECAVRALLDNYFIVRISWVFGENGKNFVKTMLRLAQTRDEITVVCDQTGSPTYTPDLAVLLCDMIKTDKYGTYHATNEGCCSWAEFAAAIMELSGSGTKIIPIPGSDYPSAAVRPENSRMSKRSLDENGFARLPHWKDALKRFLK